MRRERLGWRTLLAQFGYGGGLLLAMAMLSLALAAGQEPPRATLVAILGITPLLLIIERLSPHTGQWRPGLRSMGIDVMHSAVTAFAMAPLARALILALLVDVGARMSEVVGFGLWPAEWPLALQFALALLIADLGIYAGHRFMHQTRLGWRIHAVHHSPAKLHVLASARSHPFNVMLTVSVETGPLILLGITPEAFAAWTVFKAVNGLLQHSNIEFRPGWLSYVVATSDVHRYHHSVHLDESNTNFGNTTVLWDHVFGTFHLPRGEQAGTEVGITDAIIPESYLSHLMAPFRLGHLEALAARRAQPDGGGPA